MSFLALTDDIDLIQVLLVAFFLFFALLVVYLRREDKREGYPLVSRTLRHRVIGWPAPPPPKSYRLIEGGLTTVPHRWPQAPLADGHRPRRVGAALTVAGDPVLSELGAGAFAMRRDDPITMKDGRPMLMPLRTTHAWQVHRGELDPRGMRVLAKDYTPVGTVADLWVDRDVKILRYLEVTLDSSGDTVLLPIFFAHIRQVDREVRVKALKTKHFERVPRLAHPERMSPREEDRITAFYAGGSIYADSILFP